MSQRTEEYTAPQSEPPANRGRERLLVAFPDNLVLPVPPANEEIGRAWFAEHGRDDKRISNFHFKIDRRGVLRIEDGGSRNGTFLNGHKIQPQRRPPLHDGDILRIGETIAVYRKAYGGPDAPEEPVEGLMIGPFGLTSARRDLDEIFALFQRKPALNVLVEGETGTGKELMARAIAARLKRKIYTINVADIAPDLFQSELFGHVRGAFSGATSDKLGVFLQHDHGAVFLDEIGELPSEHQAPLLRLLEYREVRRTGEASSKTVDIVIIAATNRDLEDMVVKEKFRHDLWGRFDTRVKLPGLAVRVEDIFAIIGGWRSYDRDAVDVDAVETLMLAAGSCRRRVVGLEWQSNIRGLLHEVRKMKPARSLRRVAVEHLRHLAGPPPPTTVEECDQAVQKLGSKAKAAQSFELTPAQFDRLMAELRATKAEPGTT